MNYKFSLGLSNCDLHNEASKLLSFDANEKYPTSNIVNYEL